MSARTRRGFTTRRAFAEASGLSERTLSNIERARKHSYDPGTLSLLEHALAWESGSVAAVLSGRRPRPAADEELAAIHDVWPLLSTDARRMLARLARDAVSR